MVCAQSLLKLAHWCQHCSQSVSGGEPVEHEPFHTIGWAKLSRTNDTLQVLENAAEFKANAVSVSSGIVVGVPEPAGSHVSAVFAAIACFGCARRRRMPSGG